ncbi:hypothetical protein HN51_036473 [Arachis hypogaea]
MDPQAEPVNYICGDYGIKNTLEHSNVIQCRECAFEALGGAIGEFLFCGDEKREEREEMKCEMGERRRWVRCVERVGRGSLYRGLEG